MIKLLEKVFLILETFETISALYNKKLFTQARSSEILPTLPSLHSHKRLWAIGTMLPVKQSSYHLLLSILNNAFKKSDLLLAGMKEIGWNSKKVFPHQSEEQDSMKLTTLLSLWVSILSTNCIATHEEFCETTSMQVHFICSLLEMYLHLTSSDYSHFPLEQSFSLS